MTRTDYLNEIQHFKTILSYLDAQHRANGNAYTPSEIQNVRRAITVLEQLVEVGVYDVKRVIVSEMLTKSMEMLDTEDAPRAMNEALRYTGGFHG